jgi:hypothetical protein
MARNGNNIKADMTLEIQVLSWDRHKHVAARLNLFDMVLKVYILIYNCPSIEVKLTSHFTSE